MLDREELTEQIRDAFFRGADAARLEDWEEALHAAEWLVDILEQIQAGEI